MPAPYFFFFNDTATTEIYTLSLHDALPISVGAGDPASRWMTSCRDRPSANRRLAVWYVGLSSSRDRKSTRLNSSHGYISYAAFCLKKKKNSPASMRLST